MKRIETDISMYSHFKDMLKLAGGNGNSKKLYTIHISKFDKLEEEEMLALLDYENVMVMYFKNTNDKSLPRRKYVRDYLAKYKPEFYDKYKLLFDGV